jgi:hypothetical protein
VKQGEGGAGGSGLRLLVFGRRAASRTWLVVGRSLWLAAWVVRPGRDHVLALAVP